MAMYRHYRGKDDLLDSVADAGFETLVEFVQKADAEHHPVVRIVLRYRAALDFAFKRPRLFELMFVLRRPGARQFPTDFDAGRSPSGRIFLADMQAAKAAGVVTVADPLEAALQLWALAHGLIVLYQDGRFGVSKQAFRGIYTRALCTLLAGMGASMPDRIKRIAQ